MRPIVVALALAGCAGGESREPPPDLSRSASDALPAAVEPGTVREPEAVESEPRIADDEIWRPFVPPAEIDSTPLAEIDSTPIGAEGVKVGDCVANRATIEIARGRWSVEYAQRVEAMRDGRVFLASWRVETGTWAASPSSRFGGLTLEEVKRDLVRIRCPVPGEAWRGEPSTPEAPGEPGTPETFGVPPRCEDPAQCRARGCTYGITGWSCLKPNPPPTPKPKSFE